MTNLEQKFNDLETKLLNQHTSIANKLDAILVALGAPPPTSTTTLADIAFILNAIHADTTQTNTKLIAANNDLDLIASRLLAVNNSVISLDDPLTKILRTVNGPDNNGVPGSSSASIWGYVIRLYNLLADVAGLETDEPRSMVQYLADISTSIPLLIDATKANMPPVAVSPATKCSNPLVSVPNVVVVPASILQLFGLSSFRDIVAANWPLALPNGMTYYNRATGPDSTTLFCTSWSKYQIYVESSAGFWQAGINLSGTDPVMNLLRRFSCNQWIPVLQIIGDNLPLSVFVDATESLKVYLCGDYWSPGGGSGGYFGTYTLTSQPYTSNNAGSGHCIVWTGQAAQGGIAGGTDCPPIATSLSVAGYVYPKFNQSGSFTRTRKGINIYKYPLDLWTNSDPDVFAFSALEQYTIIYSSEPFTVTMTLD